MEDFNAILKGETFKNLFIYYEDLRPVDPDKEEESADFHQLRINQACQKCKKFKKDRCSDMDYQKLKKHCTQFADYLKNQS
ncbi:MAG: hypothetical protein MJB14_23825 [Spirochaetes bacterium]|nr:hypothetical protein [Spirochaetota bacterium]